MSVIRVALLAWTCAEKLEQHPDADLSGLLEALQVALGGTIPSDIPTLELIAASLADRCAPAAVLIHGHIAFLQRQVLEIDDKPPVEANLGTAPARRHKRPKG